MSVLEVGSRAWYDLVMVEDGSPAMLPLEESPWIDVYVEMARWIDQCEEVVDLGCGTGRFLELLYRRDHYARTTGIDWSETALDAAQRYISPRHPDAQPFELVCMDLDDWEPAPDRAGNTVYVCSEVLEHLADDLELVRKVPAGHRLIFSVPNFDSDSHVRVFRNVGDIWERYAPLLRMRRWVHVGSDRQGIHVIEARRRGDSW